jgi:hypothetical protein
LLLAAIGLCGVVLAGKADAQATTYQYTGPAYSTLMPHIGPGCNTGSTCSDYTPQEKVTGSFTTAGPLGPNFSGTITNLQSYNFNDGINTISSTDTNALGFEFSIETDGNGVPSNVTIMLEEWIGNHTDGGRLNVIEIFGSDFSFNNIFCSNVGASLFGTPIACTSITVDNFTSQGSSLANGTWIVVVPPPVPTLGQWALLTLAGLFGAVGWYVLRNRHMN